MKEKIINPIILRKEEADEISRIICDNFHHATDWNKDLPTFCGLMAKVLEYEEKPGKAIVKLEFKRGSQSYKVDINNKYCVVIGKGTEKIGTAPSDIKWKENKEVR